jgi:hypothetical protein
MTPVNRFMSGSLGLCIQPQGCSVGWDAVFCFGAVLILWCHLPRLVVNLEASGMAFSRLSTGRTEINKPQSEYSMFRTSRMCWTRHRLSQVARYEATGNKSGVCSGSGTGKIGPLLQYSIHLLLYRSRGSWPPFQFLNLYSGGRTSWMGDEPIARPLTYTLNNTNTK